MKNLITEDKIRLFLMDKPEYNTLVQGVRFSPQQIQDASILVVDYFNTAPPPTGEAYTIEDFPYSYMMLIGVCGLLLRGAAVNQASNELNYDAGGVQVRDQDKAQIFAGLGKDFWEEFKTLVQSTKVNRNIANAYGVENSEYISRNRI